MLSLDWNMLRTKAFDMMNRAYAPYSGFPVGAAALTIDGRIVSGCNVENVSYGLGMCAECALVANLHADGGGQLVAVSVCDRTRAILMPCGRCRQVLFEFGGAELLVDRDPVPLTLGELLPHAFGPADLDRAR